MKLNEESSAIRTYSLVFVGLMLILLLAFVPFPGLNLSTLSVDFRWRSGLIKDFNSFRFWAGDRVFNNAVVGQSGWIFYTGERSLIDERSLFDYQNTDPFKKRTLNEFKTQLDQLGGYLKKEGKTLVVVIPPNKSTIYSQYMPKEIPVIGTTSRLDQFVELMKGDDNVRVVDLRSVLIDESKLRDVYFKTDTHWNDWGAYYGYVEILKALSDVYPSLIPHPLADFKYQDIGNETKDIPLMMDIPELREITWTLTPSFLIHTQRVYVPLSGGERNVLITTNQDNRLPSLLVFHDSFYDALSKFMEPHFSKITAVPFTADRSVWNLKWISSESPDIVMIELVERYLEYALPLVETPYK